MDTLMQFGQHVRRRREELGLTLDALALRTGISKPYLSNIETGRTPGPASEEKLRKLEAALGFGEGALVRMADWLRTPASVRALIAGLGSDPVRHADGTVDLDRLLGLPRGGAGNRTPRADIATPTNLPAAIPATEDAAARAEIIPLPLQAVPLINRVTAGPAAEFTDLDYPTGVADAYVGVPAAAAAGALPRGVFACRVQGDSMEPAYRAGDVIVVGPVPPRDGDDCLVRLDESEGYAQTFKRVFFEGENGDTPSGNGEPRTEDAGGATRVRLAALNPKYPPRTLPRERVTGIYPVLWKMQAVRGGG